jgi:hypothetical protein
MEEPDYISRLLRPSTPPVSPRPTVDDGSFDDMVRFVDLSTFPEGLVAGPKTESEAPTGVFHNIDEVMSKGYDWWKPIKDVEERDEAELDMKLAMGVPDLDDRALELEPMTIDAYY